ncbi:transposase [Bacillus cytotoxicus]
MIKKYMKMMTPPTTNRWRISPAQGCHESIIRLEKEGKTLKTIDPLIRKKGYNGTFSAVRTLVEGIRCKQKRANHPSPTYQIARKRLARWFWIHPNHLNTSERRDLERCFEKYPNLQTVYEVIQEYRAMIKQSDYEGFLQWLRKQLSHKEQPFYPYTVIYATIYKSLSMPFFFPIVMAC